MTDDPRAARPSIYRVTGFDLQTNLARPERIDLMVTLSEFKGTLLWQRHIISLPDIGPAVRDELWGHFLARDDLNGKPWLRVGPEGPTIIVAGTPFAPEPEPAEAPR